MMVVFYISNLNQSNLSPDLEDIHKNYPNNIGFFFGNEVLL